METYTTTFSIVQYDRKQAIKTMKYPFKFVSTFTTEILCLKKIKHPSLTNATEITMGIDEIIINMPYFGRNLFRIIRSGTIFSAAKARKYMGQLAQGLSYLHQLNICHGDLSGNNILIKGDRAMIIDLNSAIIEPTIYVWTRTTPSWCPPEVHLCEEHTPLSDVWSLGIIWANMISGENYIVDWDIFDKQEITKRIDKYTNNHKLIRQMTQMNPQDRISADDLCYELDVAPPRPPTPQFKAPKFEDHPTIKKRYIFKLLEWIILIFKRNKMNVTAALYPTYCALVTYVNANPKVGKKTLQLYGMAAAWIGEIVSQQDHLADSTAVTWEELCDYTYSEEEIETAYIDVLTEYKHTPNFAKHLEYYHLEQLDTFTDDLINCRLKDLDNYLVTKSTIIKEFDNHFC